MTQQKKNSTAAAGRKLSSRQRKIRLQQFIMAVIGIILVLAMVLALVMNT
jgi:predicted nucleic acid-binding Zn ribbon protein